MLLTSSIFIVNESGNIRLGLINYPRDKIKNEWVIFGNSLEMDLYILMIFCVAKLGASSKKERRDESSDETQF